jgi:glycosyltransferase involved in cell wall biosynthesis
MLEVGLALQDLGHEVVVAVHDYDRETVLGEAADRLEIRAVHEGEVVPPVTRRELLRRQWQGMSAVARLIPDDVDVVNAHEWPASRAARLAARRLKVPWVWTRNVDTAWERGLIPETTLFEKPSLPGRIARLAAGIPDVVDARSADRIVVLSSRNAQAVRQAYKRDAEVIWCGPPDEFFSPPDRAEARARLGLGDDEFVAAAIGILFPHRRFEDLIEAVAQLKDEQRLRVRIVGSDHQDRTYADRLEQLIARTGTADRIELQRRGIPQAELRDLYAPADVTVFPNRVQAYGLAPLESLASGTPVILSTGIGVSEPLAGKGGVLPVPPESPAEIATALKTAMNTDLRSEVPPTRDWIRSELSNRRYAERMAAIFAELKGSEPLRG